MKIFFLTLFITSIISNYTFADQYKSCVGEITAVDDILHGYANVSGGLLLITLNSSECPNQKFWYQDDGVKTSNLMSIALMSLASGKSARIIYDDQAAFYGSEGKIYRMTVYK